MDVKYHGPFLEATELTSDISSLLREGHDPFRGGFKKKKQRNAKMDGISIYLAGPSSMVWSCNLCRAIMSGKYEFARVVISYGAS